MSYNSYSFQVNSFKPEGKYVFHDGRLPWGFLPQLGNLLAQNRSAVVHAISDTLFQNGGKWRR